MKKLIAIALIAIPLILTACKSTEQEEEPAPQPAPVETPVEDPKVDEPEPEPEPEPQPEPQPEPEPAIVIDTAAIEKLFTKVAESKDKAVKADADEFYASQIAKTDEIVADLKERFANGEDVTRELNDANYRYMAIEKAAMTRELKKKIEENGFDQKNKIAYDAAGVLLEKLEDLLLNGTSGKAMYEASDAAYTAYFIIYYDSFKKLADEERNAAKDAKRDADTVRAGVARKDEYKKAADYFKKGDSCYVTKNPQGALEQYKLAKEAFNELYQDVKAKREAAQKRIDAAKDKVKNIEDYAIEADKNNPVEGDNVDGFEEKGTVLLEEDQFENPEDAEIQLDETVKAENDSAIDLLKAKISE